MALIWPALAQMLWTLLVMFAAGRARVRAVRGGEVRLADIALSGEAWPAQVRRFSNNMNNQFETPVLFYALVLFAMEAGAAGPVAIALAWGFVATRVAHTFVHVTSNDVRRRFQMFALGLVCLAGLWGGVAFALLSGAA